MVNIEMRFNWCKIQWQRYSACCNMRIKRPFENAVANGPYVGSA